MAEEKSHLPWPKAQSSTGVRFTSRILRLLLLLALIVLALLLLHLPELQRATQDTIHSNPSSVPASPSRTHMHSHVKKVTGLYGSGLWLGANEAASKMQDFYSRSLRIHRDHSIRHGHREMISTQQFFGKYIDNAYTKIGSLLEQNLGQMAGQKDTGANIKWLFWHDADTVVINRHVSLDYIVSDINDDESVQFIYTVDQNGLNAGVFFLRVGEWASLFLASILALSKSKEAHTLKFWEQGAMATITKENAFFGNASIETPRHWFSTYAYLVKNDTSSALVDPHPKGEFLVHLVGPDKHKAGWYDFHLNIGEGNDAEYHNKTTALTLREEIKTFWNRRRSTKGHA